MQTHVAHLRFNGSTRLKTRVAVLLADSFSGAAKQLRRSVELLLQRAPADDKQLVVATSATTSTETAPPAAAPVFVVFSNFLYDFCSRVPYGRVHLRVHPKGIPLYIFVACRSDSSLSVEEF